MTQRNELRKLLVAREARIQELEAQLGHMRRLVARHHSMMVVRDIQAGETCPECRNARKCAICREAMGDMGSGIR